jgi:hypothetical protein
MTTEKQIAANQDNALKSTGPRTPEGKRKSSKNALKHGLLSREVLLPDGEEKTVLEAFGSRLRADLEPVGELEDLLVDRIITAAWRLRRVLRLEVKLFSQTSSDIMDRNIPLGISGSFVLCASEDDAFSKLSRYETAIERGMYRALHEFQRLKEARQGNPVAPPAVLDINSQ